MALFSLLRQATSSMWPTTEPIEDSADDKKHVVADRPRDDLDYCAALHVDNEGGLTPVDVAERWKSLERDMALTPAGQVRLVTSAPVRREGRFELTSGLSAPVAVEPFYIDRHAVTNAEYWAFVESSAYGDADVWLPEILPFVLQCVDQTGKSGPRYWRDGRPPADRLNHPVVGISWFEAAAYAAWIGKRLVTPSEWQRAGTWPAGEGKETRYPWGNSFQRERANIRGAANNEIAPVDEFIDGCTPNGVFQLIGNVWEWTSCDFEFEAGGEGLMIAFDQPMAEVRGAAFDTYFETQATCQFRTGKAKLARPSNVGFRCAVSTSQLQQPPTAFDLLDDELAADS